MKTIFGLTDGIAILRFHWAILGLGLQLDYRCDSFRFDKIIFYHSIDDGKPEAISQTD